MSIITTTIRSFYRKMQKRHPGVLFYGNPSRREIALTFDDGPHPRDTPHVLDVLAKHNVHATFFLVGRYVDQYPKLVKRIYQDGHHIGIHCHRHFPFPLENASTLKEQLDRTRIAIANVCGFSPEAIRDVRPPYGLFTAKILSHLTEWGYRLVLWDNMPLHFIQPTSWTIRQILEPTAPGSVIVLHDGNGHGRRVASIVDTIVPRLKEMGFNFSKVENMKRDKVHG